MARVPSFGRRTETHWEAHDSSKPVSRCREEKGRIKADFLKSALLLNLKYLCYGTLPSHARNLVIKKSGEHAVKETALPFSLVKR